MFTCDAQKRSISHIVSSTVNYHFIVHSDVSYRFNRENDIVVLDLYINCLKESYQIILL